MCWLLPLRAEILRRRDQACPEQHLPVAIHNHSRRQWLFRSDKPFGESEAIAWSIWRKWRKTIGCLGLHLRTKLVILTAHKDERLARLLHVFHHHRARNFAQQLTEFLLAFLKFAGSFLFQCLVSSLGLLGSFVRPRSGLQRRAAARLAREWGIASRARHCLDFRRAPFRARYGKTRTAGKTRVV